jgi:hypothetical protein
MDDLELVKKCAEKMGFEIVDPQPWWAEDFIQVNDFQGGHYNPTKNDAQAMALVKKFQLDIEYGTLDTEWSVISWETDSGPARSTSNADLNRAICECVAKLP